MTPEKPTPPPLPPRNAAQRRAAEMLAGAGKQAQLKREAAERRAARAVAAKGPDAGRRPGA